MLHKFLRSTICVSLANLPRFWLSLIVLQSSKLTGRPFHSPNWLSIDLYIRDFSLSTWIRDFSLSSCQEFTTWERKIPYSSWERKFPHSNQLTLKVFDFAGVWTQVCLEKNTSSCLYQLSYWNRQEMRHFFISLSVRERERERERGERRVLKQDSTNH